jgi:hypothetical protein
MKIDHHHRLTASTASTEWRGRIAGQRLRLALIEGAVISEWAGPPPERLEPVELEQYQEAVRLVRSASHYSREGVTS